MEFDSSTKRKSARLSKKPKILDEYVIDSSQDSINSKQLPPPVPQTNQLQELDNLPTSLTNRIQQATKEKCMSNLLVLHIKMSNNFNCLFS
jgi:hypothetical protein